MKTKTSLSQYLFTNISICVALFMIIPADSATVREKLQKNISFAPGGYLNIVNSNGSIEITSWERDEVEIIAYKEIKAASRAEAERLMEKLEIDIKEEDNELFVETYFPRGTSGYGFFSWLFGKGHVSFSVEYEVKVPKSIDLNLQSTNGGIYVDDIQGLLRLETTNGKIRGHDIDGLVKSKTTNGSINIDFENIDPSGSLSFKTTNGSIKLYLPENFGADAELRTTNGRIETDFGMSDSRRRSKRRYDGKIGNGVNNLRCKTTNGSIYLFLND